MYVCLSDWLGEPDDTNHVENCGALNIVGEVSDEKCSERHGFICEYPTTSTYLKIIKL